MPDLKIIIIITFLTGISTGILAQKDSSDFFKLYREIINEKIKIDLNNSNLKQTDEQINISGNQDFRRSSGNEKQITTETIAESEIHSAINPTDSNNWVLAPIRLKQAGGFTLPVFYTKNFGKSWSQSSWEATPPSSSASVLGGGDPVFAFSPEGKLYFSWIHLYTESSKSYTWGLFWAWSEDGGETWNTAKNNTIISSTGNSLYTLPVIADKQWMAIDHSNSPYRNTLYVAYLKADMVNQVVNIVVNRKPADSAEFIPTPVNVYSGSSTDVQFAQVVVDNHGLVHVTFKQSNSFYHAFSKDGGKSFSTPVKITDFQKVTNITGIKSNRLYPAPALAVDNSNSPFSGRLYLTFTAAGINYNSNSASDIYLTWSSDTGATWSDPIIVNDDNKLHVSEQFYSTIHVNPDGVLSLAWYDGRHSTSDSSNEIVYYYVAHSFDGGLNFTNNYNVSSLFTNFQTIGYKNNQFGIGEYNQILSTSGYCIPIWSDGRKGNGDLDVFIAITEIQKNPATVKDIYSVERNFNLIELSPNPCDNKCFLTFSTNDEINLKISLYSADGKIISVFKNNIYHKGQHSIELNCSRFKPGLYYIVLETEKGIISERLIIRR